jgi:hypothetical protein
MKTSNSTTKGKMPGETLALVLYGAALCVIIVAVVIFFVALLSQVLGPLVARTTYWLESGRTVLGPTSAEVMDVVLSVFVLGTAVLFALVLFGLAVLIKLAGRIAGTLENLEGKIENLQ